MTSRTNDPQCAKPNFGTVFRIRDDRQAKALTGCNLAMLNDLLPVFEQLLDEAIASRILEVEENPSCRRR